MFQPYHKIVNDSIPVIPENCQLIVILKPYQKILNDLIPVKEENSQHIPMLQPYQKIVNDLNRNLNNDFCPDRFEKADGIGCIHSSKEGLLMNDRGTHRHIHVEAISVGGVSRPPPC